MPSKSENPCRCSKLSETPFQKSYDCYFYDIQTGKRKRKSFTGDRRESERGKRRYYITQGILSNFNCLGFLNVDHADLPLELETALDRVSLVIKNSRREVLASLLGKAKRLANKLSRCQNQLMECQNQIMELEELIGEDV